MKNLEQAQEVVKFWQAAGPQKWFAKDAKFDHEFKTKFYDLHFAAARQELEPWLKQADSALALILLLDQYPRNSFRDTAHMFATDGLALSYARQCLRYLPELAPAMRNFICLPFMHSEDIEVQEESVVLYINNSSDSLYWAQLHRDIIAKFGRFPHRNKVLGRTSSKAELEFLEQGGFSG